MCVCVFYRFDIVLTILKQSVMFPIPSPSPSSQSGLQKDVSSTATATSTSSSATTTVHNHRRPVSNVVVGMDDPDALIRYSSQPLGDNSIIHFHRMTRIEAIQVSIL